MIYRNLGNTGLKVSEIGLGCEGFIDKTQKETNQLFALATAQGVNYMDLYSPNPQLHRHLGVALNAHRGNFMLQGHLCSAWQDGQYKATRNLAEVQAAFEQMLTNLACDYIDVGMIHYVDSMSEWNNVVNGGVMDYALALKKQGKIKHIGMSCHNPVVALAAVNSGLIEVLMFSVNPCYDLLPADEDVDKLFEEQSYANPLLNFDQKRVELYETCQRMGVGITVMKAFGGGDLLNPDSPAGVALTVNQCIHYALTRPAVTCVLVGAHNLEELTASLNYEYASDADKDYAATFSTFPKISWEGHCMYCGHCAPCPVNIDVAMLTKLLNLAKAQKTLPETVREHYAALTAHASDCIGCGGCEQRCPFKVKVRENMRQAVEIFGK